MEGTRPKAVDGRPGVRHKQARPWYYAPIWHHGIFARVLMKLTDELGQIHINVTFFSSGTNEWSIFFLYLCCIPEYRLLRFPLGYERSYWHDCMTIWERNSYLLAFFFRKMHRSPVVSPDIGRSSTRFAGDSRRPIPLIPTKCVCYLCREYVIILCGSCAALCGICISVLHTRGGYILKGFVFINTLLILYLPSNL